MNDLQLRLVQDLALRDRSTRTIESYLHALFKLSEHYDCCPSILTSDQLRAYLLYLLHDRGLAPSTVGIVISAIKFFFCHTLGRPEVVADLPRPKRRCELPNVISGQQVERFIDALPKLRDYTIASVLYGCGLRVTEACGLRVDDIDSARMIIHVRKPKNRHGRIVPLSPALLHRLRHYWKVTRPERPWLFPSRATGRPITRDVVDRAFRRANESLRWKHRVTPHVLRHCFATHQLERGVDLLTLQFMLGHRSQASTQRYLHISTRHIRQVGSPLDILGTPAGRILG